MPMERACAIEYASESGTRCSINASPPHLVRTWMGPPACELGPKMVWDYAPN